MFSNDIESDLMYGNRYNKNSYFKSDTIKLYSDNAHTTGEISGMERVGNNVKVYKYPINSLNNKDQSFVNSRCNNKLPTKLLVKSHIKNKKVNSKKRKNSDKKRKNSDKKRKNSDKKRKNSDKKRKNSDKKRKLTSKGRSQSIKRLFNNFF